MSWAFTDITVENVGIDFNVFLSDNWKVNLGYNEQTFERQRFESSPSRNSYDIQTNTYTSNPYDRFDDWQFTTAFIDFIGEFETAGIQHQFLIGANSLDYYYGQLRTSADSFSFTAGQNEPARPDVSYKTDLTKSETEYDYYGVYAQDLITFSPQWQVSVGGRFDKQTREGQNNESFLPKFGVLYHPNASATIYASYTEGFEPQNETITDEEDINFGMKIDAVTSEQRELGIKWQLFDERLMLSGAIFDISKNGTLVTEQLETPIGSITSETNQVGEQRHKGFEMAAQGAATDRLFVMASTMYLDANYERANENLQGKRPVDAPKWSASLWTRYELNDAIAFNAGAFYEGERFADSDNSITKDAYTRVDVGATYKFIMSNTDINLRLNVENLFDTDYLGGGGNGNVTIGEGTNLRLAAQFNF